MLITLGLIGLTVFIVLILSAPANWYFDTRDKLLKIHYDKHPLSKWITTTDLIK